jgi:hypothetical protein
MNVAILESMEFKNTYHEPCMYDGVFKIHHIHTFRQVDYMVCVGELKAILHDVWLLLDTKKNIEVERKLTSSFNGLEIVQSRDNINIHVIGKIIGGTSGIKTMAPLQGHSNPSIQMPIRNWSPLSPPLPRKRQPLLKKTARFSYCTVIDELMFTYVICRLDIGFAMTELSKSTPPHSVTLCGCQTGMLLCA